jgi:hypothetical protein
MLLAAYMLLLQLHNAQGENSSSGEVTGNSLRKIDELGVRWAQVKDAAQSVEDLHSNEQVKQLAYTLHDIHPAQSQCDCLLGALAQQ